MIEIDDRYFDRRQFDELVAETAAQAGLGEKPDRRYAVCFSDTARWLALFFAIRGIGASVFPIHPATPHAAARRMAEAAGCDTLFWNSLAAEALSSEPSQPPQGQLIQMSSGTTGAPKCIARGWREIDAEVASYAAAFREPRDMTPVVACPTTHSYGLICGILVALHRGRTPVVVDAGNPKYLLRRLHGIERPLLYSSPAVLHTLARLLPQGEAIHAAMTSGTILPGPWFERIRARTTHLYQQYGCSEAGCIAINPDLADPADMGFVLPHHVVTASNDPTAPAEIVVSGPAGTVLTRDLGYLRPDGMLVFVSRLDDTINVSGLNVYPKEVEDVVMAMPGVTDAVAFRKADALAGERVGLLFSADRALDGQALRAWCAENLAGHQVPMEFVQIEAVPRQANGKISRREVAAQYAAGRFAVPAREVA
ncbi:AMP-binding protein [Kumtagia ephedrae]|uniref:AMP-binding protein n=1 Tax=Kumtagia ephedrae TaxID=2116701 RepID=UPI001FE1A9E9|nr:AMP-binding protein [Mesorhizobium ephedrae]